jgi:diadenosine tetraphosphate (Ap4A) HIT family hydrolase
MSFLIPAHRLFETRTLMAFQHPQPVYPVHILIVLKRAISSPTSITDQDQVSRATFFDVSKN